MEPRPAALPIDSRLLAMRAAGFSFATNRDSAGLILALVGVRVHDGVTDIVQLYGEDDADAIRIPNDEPDATFPRTVLWRTSGTATEVIDQLLELPRPAAPSRGGCWLPTEPGRCVWVTTSAEEC